jgi:hypothetical protein
VTLRYTTYLSVTPAASSVRPMYLKRFERVFCSNTITTVDNDTNGMNKIRRVLKSCQLCATGVLETHELINLISRTTALHRFYVSRLVTGTHAM